MFYRYFYERAIPRFISIEYSCMFERIDSAHIDNPKLRAFVRQSIYRRNAPVRYAKLYTTFFQQRTF